MKLFFYLLILAGMSGVNAYAATPAELLNSYVSASGVLSPSPQRGEQFFNRTHEGEWSCATCHGSPPTGQGAHAGTGKPIAPLAPAVNPERFTKAATVEKWFKRNCGDVLKRECTAGEKADVMSYLLQFKR
jgi:cytochrome c peroxidase